MTNFSQQHLPLVEKVMVDFIAEYTENERLKEAMLYSIHAGGKRLRPLLVLTTAGRFSKRDGNARLSSGCLFRDDSYVFINS